MTFKACAIVPSRNHHLVAGEIVAKLRAAGLPVFVIDDGSDEPARSVLRDLHAPDKGVTLHRFETGQGKGGAVAKGIAFAKEAGFTHAVQVDADGQHDLAALDRLLAAARTSPDNLITGRPVFDATMPAARRVGRWLTHIWVSVELLSFRIIDTMCGFRVYPIAATAAVLAEEAVGRGMDFDTDILVRLAWRGFTPIAVPVRVTYPDGNTSNFDVLRDNWRITLMHTRLVLAMLRRLPAIGRHRSRADGPSSAWFAMTERGMLWGLRLSALVYRLAGARACTAMLLPVALYFQVSGTEQRKASLQFLRRAFAARGESCELGWRHSFRHFRGFTQKAVETFGSWVEGAGSCTIEPTSVPALEQAAAEGRGLVLIVSHLGNVELSRALLDPALRARITVLVHTRHAENYNRVLRRFSPDAAINTIQVADIGPDTIIALKDIVEQGGWVAIAGDRTPVRAVQRVSYARFLGHDAPFPQGPYILAHLLDCPVYALFCLREARQHRVYFERLAERVDLQPRRKDADLAALTTQYARRLEAFCLRDPYQWYNFYDFWGDLSAPATSLNR